MDLYAPINTALQNTQSTISDLIKMYMANELNKQQMEMKRQEMAQRREETQFTQQLSLEELAEKKRQGEATRQYQEGQLGISKEGVQLQKTAQETAKEQAEQTRAFQNKQFDWQKTQAEAQRKLAETESQAKYGQKTRAEWGKTYGVHPEAWNALNMDPAAEMTEEQFKTMFQTNKSSLALTNSNAIKKQMDQIAMLGKNEKDPGMKEQYAQKYDNLAQQVQLIDREIVGDRIPEKVLVEILKNDEITDKEGAARTAKNIVEMWKNNPLKTGDAARPSDLWNKKTGGTAAAIPAGTKTTGITPEDLELKTFFQKQPAVLQEAAAIIQKQGPAAGRDYLRKKRKEQQTKTPENAEPTFGVRPGSVLSDIASEVRRTKELPDYSNIPGLTY
jgi:hypothetical protein